jgi:hypothetical protein
MESICKNHTVSCFTVKALVQVPCSKVSNLITSHYYIGILAIIIPINKDKQKTDNMTIDVEHLLEHTKRLLEQLK